MQELLNLIIEYSGLINIVIVVSLSGIVFKLFRMTIIAKDSEISLLKDQIELNSQFAIEKVPEKFNALKEYYEKNVREWYESSLKALEEEKNKAILQKENKLKDLIDNEVLSRKSLMESYHKRPSANYNELIEIPIDQICGRYQVIGHNPESASLTYIGQLEINIMGKVYWAKWIVDPIHQKHEGVGVMIGNTLAFAYISDMNHRRKLPQTGVVLYEFITSNILRGHWANIENKTFKVETVGFEECRKITEG